MEEKETAHFQAVSSLLRTTNSEQEPHGQLQLPRVAYSLADEAVEIEKARGGERILISGDAGQGIDEVVVIERIEHLDLRDDLHRLGQLERTGKPPVERDVVVVLAKSVSVRRRACRTGDRLLGGAGLDAR